MSEYKSSLLDEQWEILSKFMPPENEDGRPRKHTYRSIINGILYVLEEGCKWRSLPKDFPNWSTVYFYFRKWRNLGIWEKINSVLRKAVRTLCHDKNENPTAGSIDSQSVKNAGACDEKGYDAGKKIKGRKRHIVVDTLGLLIAVVVHSASLQDRDGAPLVVQKAADNEGIMLKKIWADSAYNSYFPQWAKDLYRSNVDIVKRNQKKRGFYVLPKRWVVERTHAWISSNRRLRVDYEKTTSSSESMIYLSMIKKMLNELTPNP